MRKWHQSTAVVIESGLLLIILLAIHLATFWSGTAAMLAMWSDWVLVFMSLLLLGNFVLIQIVDPTKLKQETSSNLNWRQRLWPVTPQRLLFWLSLGYLAFLLYFAVFAPDVERNQRDIYHLRYWSAFGVYIICTWAPGITANRRKQAGDGPPAART